MRDRIPRIPAERVVTAVAAGVAAIAASYGLVGFTRAFVFVAVDEAVVAATPGPIVTWSIETLGESGHLLHRALSVAIVVGGVALIVEGASAVERAVDARMIAAPLTGAVVWALVTLFVGTPVAALAPAAGAAAVVAVASIPGVAGDTDQAKRSTLGAVAAGLGTLTVGALAGQRIEPPEPSDLDRETVEEVQKTLDRAAGATYDFAGMEPLISENFYTVDTASTPPMIDREEWTLSITGAVENDIELTYDDIVAMETVSEPNTLRCVGENLNGKKMDTAVWTGTPISAILEEAEVSSDCGCVMLRSVDGFYEEFPVEALERGRLVYGMNGEELPLAHGHPVRAIIPGHWGEVNVKWLDEVDLLNEEATGYWEERGWQGTGPVNTVAKLHHTADGDSNYVAGHAYAGLRGISAVEVSLDGGDTWNDAELTEPLPGEDVWRQWRYEIEASGSYDVVVRAIDGNGTVQTEERSSSAPSGATGWVSETVQV